MNINSPNQEFQRPTSARLYTLDYLRGIAAFGIMIYHYLSWTTGNFTAADFMGRVGIYGVTIFYILSGLTLYHVYYKKMHFSRQDIFSFFKKRIFRIFPLLWLVTLLTIFLYHRHYTPADVILNLTGLFGLVDWNNYIALGAWSIGNELVFYLFFPFFIFLSKNSKIGLVCLSAIIFSVFLYFTFHVLVVQKSESDLWRDYVNPLNQVFFFLAGFLIGLIFHDFHVKPYIAVVMLFAGFIIFILYPVNGSTMVLNQGVNRLVFTVCCLLICFGFFKMSFRLPLFAHHPFKILGEISYSVYLLHPIVYKVVNSAIKHIYPTGLFVRLLLALVISLIVSYFVYTYFEKFFMKMGRGSAKKQLETVNPNASQLKKN